MEFKITNNIVEYEVILLGLQKAQALGVARLIVKIDSQVSVGHVDKSFQARHPDLVKYLGAIWKSEGSFHGILVRSIPCVDNQEVDTLAKAAG